MTAESPIGKTSETKLASARAWKAAHREELLAYAKKRHAKIMASPELREVKLASQRAAYKKYADKYRAYDRQRDKQKTSARALIRSLIHEGHLQRAPCVVCGIPDTHAHHEDYSKPREIVWVCHLHHAAIHAGKLLVAPKDIVHV